MVSRGDVDENKKKAKELDIKFPVLLQKGWEVSKDYAMFATPVAYLIDEDGVITNDVAVGANSILELV
jgi:peroxiredoxin